MRNLLCIAALLAQAANAQLVLGIKKAGPKVVVFGDNRHPIQLFVDDIPQGTIVPGGTWSHDFARRVHDGPQYIMISARVCDESKAAIIVQWPPYWAASVDAYGSAALTDSYIRNNPGTEELEKKVAVIVKSLKGHPGENEKKKQLENWLHKVTGPKSPGLTMDGTTCTNPSVVQGYRVPIGSTYNGIGFLIRTTITLYVQGTPEQGYKFHVENPTRTAH